MLKGLEDRLEKKMGPLLAEMKRMYNELAQVNKNLEEIKKLMRGKQD